MLFSTVLQAITALPSTSINKRTDTCSGGLVQLPTKYNAPCGSCVTISCGANVRLAQVGSPSPNSIVYIDNTLYTQLCGGAINPSVYWQKVACSPVEVPKPTIPVILYKPVIGEIWKRNQNTNAIIEWIQGTNPVPSNYPKYLNLYFVDTTFKIVNTITTYDGTNWSRWIFGYKVGNNLNLVPSLPDGKYFIKACDSQNINKCVYSNMVQISGQIDAFTFQLIKPAQSEVWQRGQSGPVIQWLSTLPLPTGYPASINIYILNEAKSRVFTVGVYNPSNNLKWTFGYKVGSNPNLVPNTLADGYYYIEIIDSNDPYRTAMSGKIQIKGGTEYVQANVPV